MPRAWDSSWSSARKNGFALAIERDLHHSITPDDAGGELQALAREEDPTAALKSWEEHDLMEVVHPVLAKKKPDYDAIRQLSKVRDDLMMAGLRPEAGDANAAGDSRAAERSRTDASAWKARIPVGGD
jgi:hypothetical protein